MTEFNSEYIKAKKKEEEIRTFLKSRSDLISNGGSTTSVNIF
jgi:hypothetical protein